MGKLITWVVVIVIAVVGILAIVNNGGGGDTIKIGVIQPLTGDAASYGESELKGIQVAAEEINELGGIGGVEVELVVEDGKCDPQSGGTAAQKLVNVDGVDFIIGGACSGETLAAAEITEPAKVILLSPSATSPDVTDAGDFVFRTIPSDAFAGQIAATYAFKELKVTHAAIFTELTDYAQGLREVFRSNFEDLGGEVVADETYTTGDTDFRTQVLKIKSAKPDVIYVVPQSITPGLTFVKQLKENGVDATVVTSEVLLDRQAVTDNSEDLEGIYGVEAAIDFEGNARAAAFKDAHMGKFGTEPGIFSSNAYDAMYLLRDAIEAVGTDTEAVRDWLYDVKDWDGVVGKITMDGNGDPALDLNVRLITGGEVTDLGAYKLDRSDATTEENGAMMEEDSAVEEN